MDRLHDRTLPLDDLCDSIVERYHASLRHSLPLIQGSLEELGATASSPAVDVMRVAFSELADTIEAHLAKEEHLLFPALAALSSAERTSGLRPPLPFATVLHPIRLMETEHNRIESALEQLREIALDVAEPDTLAPAWRRGMEALAKLDAELREHHRFENEVLFPAALDLERRVL